MNTGSQNLSTVWRAALGLLLAAALGGCAGGPFKSGVAANAGTVYIIRAPGGIPGPYPKEVDVDGKPLGTLVSGGYFVVKLAPGKHRISTPAANKAEVELRVAPGASYYVSQEVIPAHPPAILLNRIGEKFGKRYLKYSRRIYY